MTDKRKQGSAPKQSVGVMTWLARLVLLFITVTVCVTATFMFYSQWRTTGGGSVQIEGGDPSLGIAERLYLESYLGSRADQLSNPAGVGNTPITFVIAPGETANSVATNLVNTGLVNDSELFVNYLRYYGYDGALAAGSFRIQPPITIPDLAQTLTSPYAQEIELRFLEGWRLEEMAAYLAVTTPAGIEAQRFLEIVQRRVPFDLSPYGFLSAHPAGTSLEGYLFPDSYLVPFDATADDLVNLMLANFDGRVTPAMRQAYGVNGLSVREAVILASIVERETPNPTERPLVANVFYNRLVAGMLLQADPTVQYAVGLSGDNWWKSPLSQADLDLDSSYNTYLYGGLPPGPIANPSLIALEAVADPAGTPFLFFVADCTNPGSHLFAETYDVHLANVENCR